MDEPINPQSHKKQITHLFSIVYFVLASFFALFMGFVGLLYFPLLTVPAMVVLYPFLVYRFLETLRTKNWKPTILCVTLIISIFMFAHWHLGGQLLHGALWLGNAWLFYTLIIVYELCGKADRPYGLVFKLFSYTLLFAYAFSYVVMGYRTTYFAD